MNLNFNYNPFFLAFLMSMLLPTISSAQNRHLATNCVSFNYEIQSTPLPPTATASNGLVTVIFIDPNNFELYYQANDDFIGQDIIEVEYWEDATTLITDEIKLHIFECGTQLGYSDSCESFEFEIISTANPPASTAKNGTFSQQLISDGLYACTYTPNLGFEGIDDLEVIHWDPSEGLISSNYKISVSNCAEEQTTAIQTTKIFTGKVFPNPATERLMIQNIPNDVNEIVLTDMLGRVIKQMQNDHTDTEINLQFMEKGMYILLLKGEKNYQQTIIKI